MQANIIRRTGKRISPPHRGRSDIKSFTGRQERTKNYSRRGVYRTGFLKQKLPIIPAKPDDYTAFIDEYISEENYGYLSECAVHYAELLGKSIELPTGTVQDKVCLLYHRFAGILPDKQNFNIEIINGRLKWVIYQIHNWDERTFFWMPVNFITMLTGQIKEIAMSFMHLFIRENGLVRFKQGYEYDYFFEFLTEIIAEPTCYEESDRDSLRELYESYVNGEISVFLDEIYDHKPIDIIKALKDYNPVNPLETNLIDHFKNGLQFISGDNCIMKYDYDAFCTCLSDYEEDIPPISLDRIIRYVYDTNDFVCNQLEASVNEHARETYAQVPVSFLILSPDSELFMPDDYPERFAEWFLEMVEITKKITDHE